MNILIIEDEPQTANVLAEIIAKIEPKSNIVGILESVEESIEYLSESTSQPDLIFMDIQLADGLSFEIFSKAKVKCPVIFCTAYEQYTMQAFKTNGVEYILKPIKEKDVEEAFKKIEKLQQSFRADTDIINRIKEALSEQKQYKSTILIQLKESFVPLAVENISLFLLNNEMTYAYTFDNQRHAVLKPISEIENEINPDQFYRINRQMLLNRKAIKEIQPYFNRKVIIKTSLNMNEQIIVSRLKVSDFMKWVEQH
ncbi:MAG: LytTR family DNA-binding domain-containing protein [Melioribacteraceae bacterium]